ncbi:NAD-dependent epimerase/dehydratase family protein [Ferruginivarius sediminum]|uniref:NAD-dependent epimerase/dehydratase family protein n=1 Tax=Ferruginivarius sediminum TaxID=2661937 RepID=A0A369TDZ4_9PROT|nr:NAD-dependent epimerase/dehydratase family protein [Ferruginivarius sediminum]RDD63571.1 NAD-dependent epimerase/dehydratase family protein [Ferruginivarius sediminum]
MTRRVLITGGAGALGANLTAHYSARGDEVLAFDNLSTGNADYLAGLDRAHLVEGDITNGEAVRSVFDQFAPDYVLHAAASYADPDAWYRDASTNVLGVLDLIENARRHEVKRFVNFQTVVAYGEPETCPIPAHHPLRPFTSYGISKAAGEQYLMMSGLPALSLRLGIVCGPFHFSGAIPTFYRRLKDGKSCFATRAKRDFLSMADFLDFMDKALATDAPTGIFNVGSGQGASIESVYRQVAKAMDFESPPEIEVVDPAADDIANLVLDISKTTENFGWHPAIDFEPMIREQVQWYERHGIGENYSHHRRRGEPRRSR